MALSNLLWEKDEEWCGHLLDIDGDVCHHVHNIVKTFASAVDEDRHIAGLLDDIYTDFKFKADICEVFKRLGVFLGPRNFYLLSGLTIDGYHS